MSSRSITPADYASAASNRQSLPALSRRPAITSDSVIPRQILSGADPAAAALFDLQLPAADQKTRLRLNSTRPSQARWPPSARATTGMQSFLSMLVPYQPTAAVMPA